MPALTPPNNCNPIPNGPFYSPASWQICGTYLNYTAGCGICISPEGDLESWKCGLGVIGIVAGYGIQASPISSNVWQICNTGILDICGGEGVDSFGGQCTTLCLANSGVNPGVFLNPSLALDRFGRVIGVAERPPTIACCTIQAKGDLIVGLADDVGVALPVGANGSHLIVNCNCALGVQWATPAQSPFLPRCCYPTKGSMAFGTSTPDTPVSVPVGADRTYLTSCAANAAGVLWAKCSFVGDQYEASFSTICKTQNSAMCRTLIDGDFNTAGCAFYMMTVTGSQCVCETGGNLLRGTWSLQIGPDFSPIESPRISFTVDNPFFTFVKYPDPITVSWLYPNLGATGQPLYLAVCTLSGVLNPTLMFDFNVSFFGF